MAKMDADRLKELCLNNFEKVIFGVLVLFFIMMVLAATKVKPYTKKPDQLSSVCNQAKTKLDEVQEVEPVTRNFDAILNGIQEKLPTNDYSTMIAWNPILSKEGQKRRAPKAFPIKNLLVKEWHGSVQKPQRLDVNGAVAAEQNFDDGLGGGRNSTTEGVRCCILIGEIPYLEQTEEFQRKLGTMLQAGNAMYQGAAMDPMNAQTPDSPFYNNYVVERAELPADGDVGKIRPEDWINLHKKGSINEKRVLYFNPTMAEAGFAGGGGGGGVDIPEKYRPPQLWRRLTQADKETTANGKDGKTEKNKNPNIRRMNPQMMEGPNGMLSANGLLPARDTLMAPLPQIASNNGGGVDSQFNWATYLPYSDEFELDLTSLQNGMGDPALMAKLKKQKGAGKAEEGTQAEADQEDGEEEDGEDDVIQDPTNQMENQMDRAAEVRLFRYVDYTVEEGKSYVYRVKISLHNPNYQYEPAFNLENPEDAKGKLLDSEYSNVTLPVTIPLDKHFFLSGFEKYYPRTPVEMKDPKMRKWSQFVSLLPVKYNAIDGNEDYTFFSEIKPNAVPQTKFKKKKKGGLVKKEEPIRINPGQLLNLMVYEEDVHQLGNPESQQYTDPNRRRFDDEEEEDEREKELFDTQFILLDVRGGEELYAPIDARNLEGADEQIRKNPEGIYSPSYALFMGPKGELVIQSELEDVAEVYKRRDKRELEMPNEMLNNPEETMQDDSKNRRGKRRKGEEMPPPEKQGRRNRLRDRL